jgi:hypothetical protein
LIAHELTHVIQQNSSTLDAVIQRQTMEFQYPGNFRRQKDNDGFTVSWPTPTNEWRKLDVKIRPSDNFRNNHLRDTVDEDTARTALEARQGTQENTIFKRDQMATAAAALEKPYYVRIGSNVGVRVKDITAKRADRRLNTTTIKVSDLKTYSGWIKISRTLGADGKITLNHLDQWT